MPFILVKAIDFQIMNRHYSWKLQFLHVNASNLYKVTMTHELARSLHNKIPLVLPFKGVPPMTKQVMNSFFILKGHCHAIWQLYKKLTGVFASIEFQN